MKTLLLGLENPHSDDPLDDLSTHPKNATGWRLWRMLNRRTGATEAQYMRAFDRQNIRSFPLECLPGERTVLVLGNEVRQTLNQWFSLDLEDTLIHPQVRGPTTFRCIPHPSGLNRFYNDPVQRELVAMLLEELYRQGEMNGTEVI